MKGRASAPSVFSRDRWWIAYANFVTLLLAFFILLFAISKTDAQKLKQVSASVSQAFSMPAPPVVENAEPPATVEKPADSPARRWERERRDLKFALDEIPAKSAVGNAEPTGKLETREDSEGLWIALVARNFFAEGQSTIAKDLLPLVDRIGRILSRSRRAVRLVGHADPLEAKALRYKNDAPYASAWALSTARAEAIARRWIEESGIDPARLMIAGQGQYHPVGETDAEFSHARNRRVEILVLAETAE